ncbi:hypothetical protein HUJ05_001591 [Dendroctonus ponderosae]|nr:hypothetical protein HUJ05_001591 [Dendroctonus ponderosae]
MVTGVLNNYEVTAFEVAVVMRLDKICEDLATIKQHGTYLKAEQVDTTNFLADKKLVAWGATNLEEKYQVTIPLVTYQQFLAFEQRLTRDHIFKKDVHCALKSCADKDCSISKSIVRMLKKIITKDLDNQFTAIRTSTINKHKYKFRPTELCTLIEVVVIFENPFSFQTYGASD